MIQKVRKSMAIRDERYQLAGLVELDESFFGAIKMAAVVAVVL
jgi:hypothetical protein